MLNKPLLKTINVFWAAFFSFTLGQKSEAFSGTRWAWIAVTVSLIGLAITAFSLVRDIWKPAAQAQAGS